MASIHRQDGRPFWYCAFIDHTGKRHFKSTKTADKREATRVCIELQKVADKAKTGKLTEDRARKVVEDAVADLMEYTGGTLVRFEIGEFFKSWLAGRTLGDSTRLRYDGIIKSFLAFLGTRQTASLASLRSDEIQAYRNAMGKKVSAGSVNVHLKVLRVCLEKAVKNGVFDRNPARMVDNLDASQSRQERRAFTLPELKKVLAVSGEEWRTLILIGLYTGLRLQDAAGLTWANVDLAKPELTVKTAKTGRTVILPIAKPLLGHLESLPTSDDPKAPLCPTLCSASTLSGDFYELMASAGLVKARGHQKEKEGKGRGARRTLSDISFHSLRHTATSLLKNAGVSDVVTRDIIGHESEAVSRNYTHIDSDTKRAAIDKMPNVLK